MITLRLFHQSDPFHQIDERPLDSGEIVIGRGVDADWSLSDPRRLLSRQHCSIGISGEIPVLRDLSSNGVFVGADRARVRTGETVSLRLGETLRFGDYLMVVDAHDRAKPSAPDQGRQGDGPLLRSIVAPAVNRSETAVGSSSQSTLLLAETRRPSNREDEALLDAFCAGAHLDASTFTGEDPAAVMRRVGAVYQQMVVGLTTLMDERTSLKTDYRMDRTSIRPAGNNPFRWASAQRVAVDLLREREDGFLSGSEAVKAAFGDVKKHLLCVVAGVKGALDATIEALSPKVIEARVPAHVALIKGRANAAWSQYVASHRECQAESGEDHHGLSGRAFRAAYGRQLHALDDADVTA